MADARNFAKVEDQVRLLAGMLGEFIMARKSLVGMLITDARALARKGEYTLRVVKKDGHVYQLTPGVDYQRLDVEVEDGIVTKVVNP